MPSSCGPLASTDGRSVGFSTRRDDPSNREFSSIDNDRPLTRPQTVTSCAMTLPSIDIPEPMQERVAAFVVGSRLGGGCSTTDCCCCAVLPTTSAAFAATSLSFSGALLLNIPTSVCRRHLLPKLSS